MRRSTQGYNGDGGGGAGSSGGVGGRAGAAGVNASSGRTGGSTLGKIRRSLVKRMSVSSKRSNSSLDTPSEFRPCVQSFVYCTPEELRTDCTDRERKPEMSFGAFLVGEGRVSLADGD